MTGRIRTTDLLLMLVVLTWGAHFAVVKQALSVVDPMSFSVLRFAAAAAFLFALVKIVEGDVSLARQDWLPMLGLGLLGGLNQVLWMYGLRGTTSGKSALLLAASPAFVALMRAARGERIGPRSAAALALAFAGVALIVDIGGTASDHLVGDALTVGAALMWATYVNTGPRMLARYSPLRVTAYVFAITAGVTAIPGLAQAVATPWSQLPASVWLQLAYSTFLAGGLSWVLWYRGVSELGPVRVMLYQYLVPVFALAISVTWMSEPFRPVQGLGALLVLVGTAGARLFLPPSQPVSTADGAD